MDCRPHCETTLKTEPLSWGSTHGRRDEAVSRAQNIITAIILTEANPQLEVGEVSTVGMEKWTLGRIFWMKLNFGFKRSDTIT